MKPIFRLLPLIGTFSNNLSDENVDVKNRFQVRGYPTLYLIKDD